MTCALVWRWKEWRKTEKKMFVCQEKVSKGVTGGRPVIPAQEKRSEEIDGKRYRDNLTRGSQSLGHAFLFNTFLVSVFFVKGCHQVWIRHACARVAQRSSSSCWVLLGKDESRHDAYGVGGVVFLSWKVWVVVWCCPVIPSRCCLV